MTNTFWTPRMCSANHAVGNKIYIFGGASGREFRKYYCSIVDNWVYDTETDKWDRIIDCPTSKSNWNYSVLYKNRYIYILLVGGAIINGSIINNNIRTVIDYTKKERKEYGTIRQNMTSKKPKMCGEILVYDTIENLFYKIDNKNNSTPLPVNINKPLVVLKNDKLYVIGGEIDTCVYNKTSYKLRTDLAIMGDILQV